MSSALELVVELVTPSGQPLPSHMHGGTRYFIGKPKQEFLIRARLSHFSVDTFYLDATIDGRKPGYTKVLSASKANLETMFEGWRTDAACHEKVAFVFSAFADEGGSSAAGGVGGGGGAAGEAEDTAGVVHMRVFKGEPDGVNTPLNGVALPAAATRAASDEKKFYTKPGLAAGSGRKLQASGFCAVRIKSVGSALAEAEVRYDLESHLRLRGILPQLPSTTAGQPAASAKRERIAPSANADSWVCDLTGEDEDTVTFTKRQKESEQSIDLLQ